MNAIVTAVILSLIVLTNSPKEASGSVIRIGGVDGIGEDPYDCFEKCLSTYENCHYSCALPMSGCEGLCTSPFTECLMDCPLQ